jgi:hypothetical protein
LYELSIADGFLSILAGVLGLMIMTMTFGRQPLPSTAPPVPLLLHVAKYDSIALHGLDRALVVVP